jgi:cytochrome P450
MFKALYQYPQVLLRHANEPLAKERSTFLSHLARRGASPSTLLRYARQLRVIAHMLGVPEADGDLFIKWIHEILELGITDEKAMYKGLTEMSHYFIAEMEVRKGAPPRDDLIGWVMTAEINGKRMSPELGIGMLRLIMIAGIVKH